MDELSFLIETSSSSFYSYLLIDEDLINPGEIKFDNIQWFYRKEEYSQNWVNFNDFKEIPFKYNKKALIFAMEDFLLTEIYYYYFCKVDCDNFRVERIKKIIGKEKCETFFEAMKLFGETLVGCIGDLEVKPDLKVIE